jgi:hypothetical protein
MRSLLVQIQAKWRQQQRLLLVVGAYVVIWLILWYFARIADVLGGVSLWFLPAGLRYCAFVLFGWPALLLELATILVANLLQFLSSGQTAPELFSAHMGWLVYDWCALPLAYALVLLTVRAILPDRINLALAKHSAVFIGTAVVVAILQAPDQHPP